ncbi:hypothetical protein ACVWZR_000280 [Bradyrhizobium sp. i1.3.1]
MGSRSPHRPLAWRRSQLRNYRSWRRPGSRSGALAATRRPGAGRVENAPALLGDAARRIEPENKSRILALPGDNDGDTLRSLATCARRSSTKRPGAPDALITAVRPMLATNTRGQLVYLSTPKGKLRNLALPTMPTGTASKSRWAPALASLRNSWPASARTSARRSFAKSTCAKSSGVAGDLCDGLLCSMLQKPYHPQQIVEAVREMTAGR